MNNPYQFDINMPENIKLNSIKSIKSPQVQYTSIEIEKLKHIFVILNINKISNATKINRNKRKCNIISFLGKRKFGEI